MPVLESVQNNIANCKNLFSYSENNPVTNKDSSGGVVETIFDIVSLAESIVDVCNNPNDPLAWAGLAGDAIDLIPCVTGVGEVIRGARTVAIVAGAAGSAAGVAVGATKLSKKVENAVDGFKNLAKGRKKSSIIETVFPEGEAQLKHIFRNADGHIPDTPTNRQKILDVTKNPKNYLGKDARGNDWYASTAKDGKQTWVRVRNGKVDNAGVNNVPKSWDSETGLYNNTKK